MAALIEGTASARVREDLTMAQPLIQQATRVSGRWWRIETERGESVDAIQAKFLALFTSAGSPAGAALFCDHLLLARTRLLFTPQARVLARELLSDHDGAECEEPTEGIFLAGDEGHRDRLASPDLEKAPPQQQQ